MYTYATYTNRPSDDESKRERLIHTFSRIIRQVRELLSSRQRVRVSERASVYRAIIGCPH